MQIWVKTLPGKSITGAGVGVRRGIKYTIDLLKRI